jgi:hypothetical protein
MPGQDEKSSFDEGNWIALDKRVVNLLPKDRAFTHIEAMISLTVDINNDKKNTINGYSKLWEWSRNKTRRFVNELRTGKGHIVDRKGTSKGQEIRLIDKKLQIVEDNIEADKGQIEDKKKDTTIKTKTNIKKKKKKKINSIFAEQKKAEMQKIKNEKNNPVKRNS